jgi:hypothetical protein
MIATGRRIERTYRDVYRGVVVHDTRFGTKSRWPPLERVRCTNAVSGSARAQAASFSSPTTLIATGGLSPRQCRRPKLNALLLFC